MAERWTARRGDCAIALELHAGRLAVTLTHRDRALRSEPLSLRTTEGTDLLSDLTPVAAETRDVVETYRLAVGKRVGEHEVRHDEHRVDLARPDGTVVGVVLRAAADGVALRFRLPGPVAVTGSDLTFSLPGDRAVWPLRYTPWYEEPRFSATVATLPDGDYGFPLLAHLGGDAHVLVTESDLDGRYGGSYLRHRAGTFAVTLADEVTVAPDGVESPWRVFVLGDLPTVIASHLVDDLAPAAAGPIPPWAVPGRAAWSWWSDFYSGSQLDAQLRLVDHAARHGWEYVAVDCGWDRAWMPELVAAAAERGVRVFVWVSWDWLDVRTDLAEWARWGVAGIKVDFMESESQQRYRWYDEVIAETARVGLMVNFHGSVIPRGWARTHPHVMTYEAVRGAEYYVFYSEPLSPEHNTIVPFTRNVVGSADYTPVTFSTPVRVTSDAHELALAVVLESGITHFADAVAEYDARPLAAEVLDRVAAAWDETRLLGGRPGEWVALARRRGEEWFVGVLSAGAPRTVSFPAPAAGLRLVTDGPDGLVDLGPTSHDVRLELAADGGAVLLPATPPPPAPAVPAARAATRQPAPRPAADLLVTEPGGVVHVACDDPEADLLAPEGWPTTRVAPSAWDVTVPAHVPPAHLAVLTLRRPDPALRSVLSHVRVATAPRVGDTDLVPVRPVRTRNGSGPVERDQSNGGGDPFDGSPLTIAGTTHPTGIGVCGPADVEYALGGYAARFTALVGIDDETPGTSATADVLGDGTLLVRLELRAGQPPRPVDVDVRGVHRLALVVHGTTTTPPHVDWVGPLLHRPPTGRTSR